MPDRSQLPSRLKVPCGAERRQFGRRTTVWHAWIVTTGAHRTACVVRNISARGALLEFDVPAWLPSEFVLALEDRDISVPCEVRHRGQHGIGISFRYPEDGQRLASLAGGHATQTGSDHDEAGRAFKRPRLTPELLRKSLQSNSE